MKKLTINRIAAASLRTGKRAYVSLAIGIFLSIFLVTSMCLGVQGFYLARERAEEEQQGRQEIILLENEVTDTRLMSEGHFDELGHVYVTAQIEKTGKYVGYYDETAADMLAHRCMEGRMPERAGEIALERNIIEQSRMNIEVGDTLTLSLTPIGGTAEERTFTLVGILNERSEQLSTNEVGVISGQEHPSQMPAALVHPSEAAFATGRTSVIRVLTVSDRYTLKEVILAWTRLSNGNRGNLFDVFYVYHSGIAFNTYDIEYLNDVYAVNLLTTESLMLILLCAALLIAAGVGIAQAMNSRLAHRSEEIGMLRAVGATKRQIKKIFGRESWILMLILTPFSVAAGCAAVWGMARLFPENLIFSPTISLLIPIVLLSGACILLSSRLPLRRASNIMPMSVLRDTAILRKAKRIKPKEKFVPQNLIAGRMLKLYPSRQVGSVVLIALMLICVMLVGFVSRIDAGGYYKEQMAAFQLWSNNPPHGSGFFDGYITAIPENALSNQDLAQIRSLPYVEDVRLRREMDLILEMDEPHEYFMGEYGTVFHLMDESYQSIYEPRVSYAELIRESKQEHQEMQAFLGTDKLLIPYDLTVLTITQEQADALGQYVTAGKVDLEALNSGREVIVVAPSMYMYLSKKYGTYNFTEDSSVNYVAATHNDAFYAGQMLNFAQISCSDADLPEKFYNLSARQVAENGEIVRGSVKVGALFESTEALRNILSNVISHGCIITTEQGKNALGLSNGWLQEVDVTLSGAVDVEMEQYLEERIHAISMRGEGYTLWNYLEDIRREEQQKQQLILCFGCMALVFLIVSISMIAGNVSRRIRSDERMIGTLRAVGANESVLRGCYSRQVMQSVAWGLGISILAACISVPMLENNVTSLGNSLWMAMILMLAFAAVCAMVCYASLTRSVRGVMHRSIVQNIREL